MAPLLLAVTLIVNLTMTNFAGAVQTGESDGTINYIANEKLAPGIHYSEEDQVNFAGGDLGGATIAPHRVRLNHLSIDLSEDGVRLSTAKSDDTINARETVGTMAERETTKGNNVVAAINADPYDMDYGINCGIQVQNGNIVISEPTVGYTTNSAPAFFVDSSGAHIDPLRAVFDVSVGNEYSHSVTSFNRNSFGSWYSDPQKLTSDTLRLFTSSITLDNTMTHYRETTNPLPDAHAFALLRLDDYYGEVHAGTAYTGTVVQVYNEEGFVIPEDCIVLAGYAGDAAGVSALEAETEVSFSGNLYTGAYTTDENGCIAERGDLSNDVTMAVNGYHLLAKGGVVNTDMVENQGTDINARTVIGITVDGKIEIICANKPGSANISSAMTTGTYFKEITEYMMDELGCVDVLNMDGGGSTEMVARRAGSHDLTTVSYPSDGTSRLISNSLIVISDAQRTANIGQVIIDSDVTLYQGAKTSFSFSLTDVSGSSMSTDGQNITWKAEVGTIDQNGKYTAPSEPGTDTITGTVDGVSGTATVTIVDTSTIASIGLTDSGTIALSGGDTHQFGFSAETSTGRTIVISPDLAEWVLDGDVGTLDENGLLTVTASSGEGTVTCTLLGQSYAIPVVVGLTEQVIDDFEGGSHRALAYKIKSNYIYPSHPSYWGGSEDGMVGVETDSSKVKDGAQSLYVVYDTSSWTRAANGTLTIVPFWDDTSVGYGFAEGWTSDDVAAMEESYTAKAMPQKFGMWIYSGDENGDGVSDNYYDMCSCYFVTGYGTSSQASATLKMTPDEHMNWIGWKWVEMDIPDTWQMPIVFNYMMVSNINKALPVANNYRTTLMFDDLKYIYSDEEMDSDGPVFANTTPQAGGIYKDSFTFSTEITDELGAVEPNSVTVTVNGESFSDYTFDKNTGHLSFTESGLADGETLRIIVKTKDTKGNDSVPYIDNTYTVDMTPDMDAPTIAQVSPSSSAVIRIPSPRIGFQLTDAKSGVDPDTIAVSLNGQTLNVYYDSDTGWGYAQPNFSLDVGSYPLTINASDKTGNAMTTYTDTLTLNPIPQPADPNNYSVSIIPDSQGNEYTQKIYDRIKTQDPDFIIHTGDVVDGTGEDEYIAGKEYIGNIGLPYLTIPGNHEAGGNNLNYYYEYFGSPTYAFDYGCTRFIGLNSSYNQSISASDSTQYHYLEELLAQNNKSNIVIFSHVISRDPYSTEHNMTDAEATAFENILTTYKAAHPKVSITVLFGHLHTLASWEVSGVNYIIDGNAAGKGYVTQDEGNFLGSGILNVSDGTAAYKYEPLVSKIYIQNAAMTGSSLSAVTGASFQLNLYGDFHETAVNSSSNVNYVTQLNDDKMVDITWSSSDPKVASVSDTGVVTTHSIGQVKITASCGGKTSEVAVNAIDQNNLKITKLALSLPQNIIRVGDSFVPTVQATDPYGSTVVLQLTGSMLSVEPASAFAIGNEGTLTASNVGVAVLTVSTGGQTASASITVEKALNTGSSDTSSTRAYPATSDDGKNVSMSIHAYTSSSGSAASAALDSQDVSNILDKAKSASDGTGGTKTIQLTIKTDDSVDSVSLSMPATQLKNIANHTDADVVVDSEIGSISFDAEAVKNIANSNSSGSVKISISKVDTSNLTDEAKNVIGSKPVYNLSVISGDETITSFGGGTATVTIPYTLSEGENPNEVIAYYISGDGSLIAVPYCQYDAGTKSVTFNTTHFSNYALAYNGISFSDASGWYQDYVHFLAARNIIQGTGDGLFRPNENITRAQFVTILANLSGADLSGYKTSSFTDVSTDDWYSSAVQWSYANSISTGFNGMFYPNAPITRQDIAILIVRYAEKFGYTLQKVNNTVTFTDSNDISAYAADAVLAMQQAGIISGNSDGSFAPGAEATRAEAAKMVALLIQTLIG